MKKIPPTPEFVNMLQDIHLQLTDLSVVFRERICEECNWSIPTFYRKTRGVDRVSENNKDKIIPALSNAEKEKIIAELDEIVTRLWIYCDKYRKNPGNTLDKK
jgi:hypothetical protein